MLPFFFQTMHWQFFLFSLAVLQRLGPEGKGKKDVWSCLFNERCVQRGTPHHWVIPSVSLYKTHQTSGIFIRVIRQSNTPFNIILLYFPHVFLPLRMKRHKKSWSYSAQCSECDSSSSTFFWKCLFRVPCVYVCVYRVYWEAIMLIHSVSGGRCAVALYH